MLQEPNEVYKNKSESLIKRFSAEMENAAADVPLEFVKWLIQKKAQWSSNTWRIYKGASMYFLTSIEPDFLEMDREQISKKDREKSKEINLAKGILSNEYSQTGEVVCKSRKNADRKTGAIDESRTSGNKFKSVPVKQKEIVFAALNKITRKGNEFSELAIAWLQAGIITGIRPSEWEHTELLGNTGDFYYSENDDEILKLVVKNAKHSHEMGSNRGNGDERTLIMTNLNEEDIKTVIKFYDLLQDFMQKYPFKKVYNRARQILHSGNTKSLPKSSKFITLYSARHQFVSDRKAIGEHPAFTAALLGHSSIKTAKTTYGRRASGKVSGGSMIMPCNEDVQRIIGNTPQFLLDNINNDDFNR